MQIVQSLFYFLVAAICEIGGGYLLWQWLRGGKALGWAILGAVILVFYGVVATLQPASASFGRVYAAYGGVFIVLSLLWGWQVDKVKPDRFDLLGAGIALLGALVIMYGPRN
ncbi:YnfA family protein [Anthocerotibacter panamensis]|uniref:YnfA family protein n=1 Tax=Anthocerotibacter panamensis TaxID=2857077 RepID=UPI0036F2A584